MGDVAEVSSNVPLPEDVVYTQREADAEEDTRVNEEQRVLNNNGVKEPEPENRAVNEQGPINESEASNNSPDGLGRYIDVKV
jgi:hypothetical protein